MISFDTNVLFACFQEPSPNQQCATSLVESYRQSPDVVICELALTELYRLLRNPLLMAAPRSGAEAVTLVQSFRTNPHWSLVGMPGNRDVMDAVWRDAAAPDFPARNLYDARLAETLRYYRVDTFYTRNVKDFQRYGFRRVVDPFVDGRHV